MYKTLCAPVTVQIELSSECTNKCAHCYNFWRANEENIKKDSLSREQVKTIFGKLADAKVFDVIITGGEPLLNKDGLLACLKESARFNIGISVNSNMVPLDKEYLKLLRDAGLKNIITSLLGPNEKIHDKISRKKNSFRKAVLNIELALKEQMNIVVNMVVSKLNIDYIKETAYFVSSLGIKKFASTKAGCPGNCDDFSKLSLTLDEFRQYLKELHEVGYALGLKIDVLESYPLCGMKEAVIYKEFTGRKCLAGVSALTIASDGKVRPCPHLDIPYGNILKEEMPVIWARMDDWRNGKFIPNQCKQCPLLTLCGGGCRMEAKMINGCISNMDPYSSFKDMEYCVQILRDEKSKKELEPKKLIENFALKQIRWRKETFGAIILTDKRSRVYLDEKGLRIIKQFQAGQAYSINDKRLNWENLNPRDFLLELSERNVVRVI